MTDITQETRDIQLNDYVFPVEFLSTLQKQSDLHSNSILLTTIEYLFSMQWPRPPKPPPELDIGSSIENFVRNVISKQDSKLLTDTSQLPLETVESEQKLDYNRLLAILQTVLAKSNDNKLSSDEGKKC